MQYRTFGSLGWKASALGFGCMRLPTLGAYEKIDEPEAIRMVRRAVDGGVNYIDTAYGYHGGTSETLVGKALRDGYRSRVRVATKLPPWHVTTAADFDRLLAEQLVRLGTDHIELYLLHALAKDSWKKLTDLDVLSWAERAIAAGKIGALGFSFHDELPVLKQIIDGWDKWALCQVMYNYLYEKNQAGTEGVAYAAARGIPVVAMEPLLGGNLTNPPPAIQALWDGAPRRRSPVEWALAWLWSRPEVSVVLSGMSTMAHVDENLALAGRARVGDLTAAELEVVANARDTYEKLRPIPCTQCKYCMPCPHGVNIPHNLGLYNTAVMYNQLERERGNYGNQKAEEKASECTQCQECEPKCPQKIKISEWMPCIDKELGVAAR